MSDTISANGACLCGAVKFSVSNIKPHVGACHCDMCRKWTGGPLMTVDCGSEIQFEGDDNISVYESSEWADRAFCKKCGTNLYYRFKAANQFFMMAGLFADNSQFDFNHQVYIDEKPHYYGFANETKNMTGEEVMAFFSSEG